MSKPYLGTLQIEANVPMKAELQEFINVTVEFPIMCPKKGSKCQKLKKNGHDVKIEGSPQVFSCQSCKIYFYPHTSWIFTQFTDLIISDIIEYLFVNNLPPKAIAKTYDVSESLITKIRYQCFDILQKKVELIRSESTELKTLENLPLAFQSAIWWDETYFRINGSSYCLILIINAEGKVLGYKFSKTRNVVDYLSILLPILDQLPEVPIFIGDGCPTYENLCKQLKLECFLIQHLHSRPWKDARLHHFKLVENLEKIEQISLQVPYNCFMSEERVTGFAVKKIVPIPTLDRIKGKRGRPKGSKDTKKRTKRGSLKNNLVKKNLKKRGRKNLEKDGCQLSFEPFPYPEGWKIEVIRPSSKSANLLTPEISEISKLLCVTYEIMNGGYIQSNLIESKNNLVKQMLTGKGLKNVYQYDYLLGAHLLSRNDLDQCYWNNPNSEIKFRSSLGFDHMLKFFQPDSKKIIIK